MENTRDFRLLIASRHPLVVAGEQEEERFLEIVRRAAGRLGLPLWVWSATRGLARDGMEPQYGTADPRKALDFVGSLPDPGVFVFADVQPALSDPLVVRRVKEIAQRAEPGQTVVLAGPRPDVPEELKGLAIPWSLEPPSPEELDALVRRITGDLAARNFPVTLDEEGMRSLVEAVRGLSFREAEQAIRQAALEKGSLANGDVGLVRNAKAEVFEAGGVLELVGTDVGTLDAVGGMDGLKEWLRVRGRALEPAARDFGLDPPRGVLLTGVPGCGKSLVAKTLARTWNLPLVLLDPARLYGSYLGQSEERLRDSLGAVESMAPAVLWVDEIEKGFAAGGEGDGGVSERILGTFLRWMQDRPPGVFLVATSNDVRSLPPEFLRRGRFDEIFFVDLPDPKERAEIFRLQLARRKRDPSAFDLEQLATASDGFSGAELEAVVVAAMYWAYGNGIELTTGRLLAELARTTPLSKTRAEDIERLRE